MDPSPRPALPNDRWAEEFATALRVQRTRAREFLAALRERQRRAQAELEAWLGRSAESGPHTVAIAPAADDPGQLAAMRGERDRLEDKLSQTEKRLDQATERLAAMEERLAQMWREGPEKAPVDPPRSADAVLEGLRAPKVRKEETQAWPPERAAAGGARREPSGGILDWEAEKRRILAALEAEGEGGAETAKNPRQEIEEVLRRTDALVADKDQEIIDLKRLLQDQSANIGSVAVGAAAVGGILDQDAIIQEERDNLRRVQEEWQEKVRNAEIEISIERAKLARQRAEIEEMLRARGVTPEKSDAADDPASKADKTPSGRWLTRLGLKDPKTA